MANMRPKKTLEVKNHLVSRNFEISKNHKYLPKTIPIIRPTLDPPSFKGSSRFPARILWVPSTVLSLRIDIGRLVVGLLHLGSGPDQYPSSRQTL